MPAQKLTKIVDHLVAMEVEDAVSPIDTEVARRRIASQVRETLALVGLCVDARNDEVYNPAPAPSSIPEDNWRRGARYPRSRYR